MGTGSVNQNTFKLIPKFALFLMGVGHPCCGAHILCMKLFFLLAARVTFEPSFHTTVYLTLLPVNTVYKRD